MSDETPMEAEFDTVAAWTEQAIAELGDEYAIPAACRGSGDPADLAWLADGLDLSGRRRFVDVGAGLGGPAAWLQQHLTDRWDGVPLLVEPMTHAAGAARRLFDLPAVAAWSEDLPLPDATMHGAWDLGVLCTSGDRSAHLGELRRVLVPGGRLSLLVLVATSDELPEEPEGNDFPTRAALMADLTAAGFRIDDEIDAADLAAAPEWWDERANRVEAVVTRDHGDDPAWAQAQEQQCRMGRLLGDGWVVSLLLQTTAR